ncbi:MAG: nodulation protein NodH [Pseudomonadota bacterium]
MTEQRFRYFTIFAAMRTGSNLLERTLAQLDGVERHGELFNPHFIGKPGQDTYLGVGRQSREARPLQLIDRMVEASRGTLPGFRLFNGHDPRVLRRCLTEPACGKIILSRTPLDSYISLKIAQSTDQWMLSNIKKRRDAQVRFDLAEFEAFEAESKAYYAQMRRMMQEHGQSAYFIDYEDLKDLPVLNGLAAYLGLEARFSVLSEPILRQNPGALSDKVVNHAEMQEQLRARGGVHVTGSGVSARNDRGGLRLFRAALKAPIAFAGIPGAPGPVVLRWLHGADGGQAQRPDFEDALARGEITQSFANRRSLREWADSHRRTVAFTVVRHPLARAFAVFDDKIFRGGEAGFPMIREQLRSTFGMVVPDEAECIGQDRAHLERIGHDLVRHRVAFHAFLDFVKANLQGQTSLRTDPRWALQCEFIDGLNALRPLSLILREDELVTGAAFIKKSLGLNAVRNAVLREPEMTPAFPLEEIVTPETQALARAAFSADYDAFGYGDWTPLRII